MELTKSPEAPAKKMVAEKDTIPGDIKFFPSGAIAFFIALVILCLVIWFGIYFLMLARS